MIGVAGNAAFNGGIDNLTRLQALARYQAAQRGQADLVNAMLQQGQPTATNPPMGQSSAPAQPPVDVGGGNSAAPATPASSPFSGPAPAAPTQTDGVTGMIPASIRQFVIDLKRQNPQAGPDEIMAALDQAMPWMTAQQKMDLDRMKEQLGFAKFEMGEKDKDRTAKQRDRQLDIAQKRADAYVNYLLSKPNGKAVQTQAKAIQAKINVYQTQLNQMTGGGQGNPSPNSPDYAKFQWLQQQVQKGKSALEYLYRSNEVVPPPEDVQLYQDQQDQQDADTSGGDASGGQ